MRAVQTNEQQMEQTELCVDAKRPPKKPPGRATMETRAGELEESGTRVAERTEGGDPMMERADDQFGGGQ
jgi:hypothetical protein